MSNIKDIRLPVAQISADHNVKLRVSQKGESTNEPEARGISEKEVLGNTKGAISKSDRPIPSRPSNPLRFKTELCRAHEEGGFCR